MITKADFQTRVMASEQTLYRVARSFLRREADQKDAVQEAVLKAWANRHKLREEKYFATWLTRIVINECKSFAKKQSRTVLADGSFWYSLPAAQASEELNTLTQAVDHLPETLRIAVVLYYMEGFSIKDVADILKIPIGTVKARLHRARTTLKLELTNDFKEA